MTDNQTQANLALFIGETYCEIEVQNLDHQIIFSKEIFLPQITLKNALQTTAAEVLKLGCTIQNVYTVCRYLERLKNFRLGGSVIQVTHKGLENNYMLENTGRFSLAASSLIIAIDAQANMTDLSEYLSTEFDRTRKINPEANKVVMNLDPKQISVAKNKMIQKFFTEKNFKLFFNSTPYDLNSIRQVLLNAGTEGTKEELTKEIQDAFPAAEILFWSQDRFLTEIENYQLYFSADDFLGSTIFADKNSSVDKVIHLDIENWMVLEKSHQSCWDSPWGKIQRSHFRNTPLSLHPLTEILIDENAFLQFSKMPAPSEPGPMTAGRGVKSLILDVFFADLKNQALLNRLFPALQNANIEKKIQSQFKVLEHGQKTESKTLNQSDIKEFIQELIHFDINRLGCSDENSLCTGNMSFLKKEGSKKSNHLKHFRWTEEIFKKVAEVKT
ncbi:MAG: hypothetical protein H7Z71_04880 [Moraxellaceae bacterium]|nr:hypothetical protein [Pseudobdellovibrionaceae bacterium]